MKRQSPRALSAVREGRAAFEREAWSETYRLLTAADAARPLGVADLEMLATAAFLIGRDDASVEFWTRAHTSWLRSGDAPRAARCAFWLVLQYFLRGEPARAAGWLARARRLLRDDRHACPEEGLLAVMDARLHLSQGDQAAADAAVGAAMALTETFSDRDLHVFSRLMRGQLLVRQGDPAAASTLFDEIMVAVTVGDVSPVASVVAYCAVIEACYDMFDLARAREWTGVLSRWCDAHPDMLPFRGTCQVHRAQIMSLTGAWPQAISQAEAARDAVHRGVAGDAFYELAELHRLHGDLAAAAEAYREASRRGRSPEPGLALLRLAQGRRDAAGAAIRRLLIEGPRGRGRPRALAACVEIMLETGDVPRARAACQELGAMSDRSGAAFLRALSAQANGCTLLAEGDARGALAALRTAWTGWQELDAPYDAARVRVQIALACQTLGDADAAELELESARGVFRRLGAAPDAARADALLRAAGRRTAGAAPLTARELQVIRRIAAGKSNRTIARELDISQRTVDRHVSNILRKLGLGSRSAATAYVYANGLV